ncbi:MAG: alanine racemase [Candidatus Thorarchaeota archaeon]|jgi:D-serine deaminase-like pyridoxal phosphate-dependent protein
MGPYLFSVMLIQDLVTPAVIVDRNRLIANIERMADRAVKFGVSLRPHIKTHKCIEIAELQKKHGAKGITVSTMGEAIAFAKSGFDDITLAVPISPDKMEDACELSAEVSLKVLVDHSNTIDMLSGICSESSVELDVLLKVDCGYHRCGVTPENPASLKIAKKIVESPNLRFEGILTHAGHSYYARTIDDVKRVAQEEQNTMIRFSRALEKESNDMAPNTVSIGSTPTMSLTDSIQSGITEIRPGSYVFFDYTQVLLGCNELEDCALSVLSRVIGVYPNHIVIDAGATALSKDRGATHLVPDCEYGPILSNYEESTIASNLHLKDLSQEHGKAAIDQSHSAHNYSIGDIVRIIPNHSCLTANLFDRYFVAEKDRVLDRWMTGRDRFATNLD